MTLTVELVTDSYTKDMTPEQRDAFRAASEDVLFYAERYIVRSEPR
jgi:hypothetical protein